ncbi:MAG TPA: hypothetical protein VFH48_10960 [Chloroflexota bacterium]|nr:hypothetical protein [Chloroflexota bacterium]
MTFRPFGSRPGRAGGVSGLDAWLVSAVHPGKTVQAAAKSANWDGARLAAEIVYDTANTGLPTGVRAFIQEGTRRLLFAAGEHEILFRVAPSSAPDAFSFVGQVLHGGLPLESASVRTSDDGETFLTDLTGGFRLPSIAAGSHRFEIATRDGVIELAPISVGASR